MFDKILDLMATATHKADKLDDLGVFDMYYSFTNEKDNATIVIYFCRPRPDKEDLYNYMKNGVHYMSIDVYDGDERVSKINDYMDKNMIIDRFGYGGSIQRLIELIYPDISKDSLDSLIHLLTTFPIHFTRDYDQDLDEEILYFNRYTKYDGLSLSISRRITYSQYDEDCTDMISSIDVCLLEKDDRITEEVKKDEKDTDNGKG